MKYVYFIQEKDEDSVFDDDDFVVYETFQTAVSISKQLIKDKLAYLKENFDGASLSQFKTAKSKIPITNEIETENRFILEKERFEHQKKMDESKNW